MVREHIETIDDLIARYVAGSLPEPARVLVESHLEMKTDNRAIVGELEDMAGDLLLDMDANGLDPRARERMLAAIYDESIERQDLSALTPAAGSTAAFPSALRNFVGFDAAEVPWRTRMPGFRDYDAGAVDGCLASLFWIRPGRPIPAHTHGGLELTLVLEGAFSDGIGHYGRGDISVADDTVEHRPVADRDGPCVAFAVTDAPLKFTGGIGRFLRDLIG